MSARSTPAPSSSARSTRRCEGTTTKGRSITERPPVSSAWLHSCRWRKAPTAATRVYLRRRANTKRKHASRQKRGDAARRRGAAPRSVPARRPPRSSGSHALRKSLRHAGFLDWLARRGAIGDGDRAVIGRDPTHRASVARRTRLVARARRWRSRFPPESAPRRLHPLVLTRFGRPIPPTSAARGRPCRGAAGTQYCHIARAILLGDTKGGRAIGTTYRR